MGCRVKILHNSGQYIAEGEIQVHCPRTGTLDVASIKTNPQDTPREALAVWTIKAQLYVEEVAEND